MNATKRQVRRAFERAASTYDQAAHLQREIGTRLVERLDLMKLVPERVLDLGCGTGVATRALQARYPDASLLALDAAHAMLLRMREAPPGAARSNLLLRWFGLAGGGRLDALCADAEQLPLSTGSVDLVFSNLALQWCAHTEVFAEALRVARPGALILFSTFGPDTLKELRAAYANVDARPHVNRFFDMHDLGDALVQAGWSDPVLDMELLTVTYPNLRALLKDLREIGATTVTEGDAPMKRGLAGRERWRKLEAAYPSLHGDNAAPRLPASYEVIYGHAWKPAPAPRREGGEHVISFHPRRRP